MKFIPGIAGLEILTEIVKFSHAVRVIALGPRTQQFALMQLGNFGMDEIRMKFAVCKYCTWEMLLF